MRSIPRILAIDSGATHVACALFAADSAGRLTLQRLALEAHGTDPAQDAQWSENTRQALQALGAREQLRGSCALAVPGHLALAKFVKTPAVDKAKRRPIIEFEAAQSIPYPLGEVVWDCLEITDDGADLELMLTAVKAEAMAGLCAAADAADFAPTLAEPGCLALWRAYRYNYQDTEGGALVVDIGARSTHLLFAASGDRFFVRTLPLAGNMVTQAVADELKLDFMAAEALKRQVMGGHSDLPENSPARAAVGRAADHFSQRLQLELTRSILGQARQAGATPPVRVYLTGGGAQLPGLAALLETRLQIPVSAYDALRHVELSEQARADGAAQARQYLPILVGLAASRVQPVPRTLNLLPGMLSANLRFRRQQPWWLAAAALLVAALVPPLWHFHAQARTAEAQLAQVVAELAPMRRLEAQNAENLARLEQIRREIGAIRGLVDSKSSWLGLLADLQHNLVEVEDVWLERLQVAGGPVAQSDATEAGRTPLRLALSGRLLDIRNPLSKVSPDTYTRVKALFSGIGASPFVMAVEDEHFDNSQPGILRFNFTIVVNPQHPL